MIAAGKDEMSNTVVVKGRAESEIDERADVYTFTRALQIN